MTFKEKMLQERRLHILKILHRAGFEMAHRLIQIELRDYVPPVGEDIVKADIAWLCEIGLVECEDLGAEIIVSKLTRRGAEVAEGVTSVPGVKRATAWD